MSVSPVKFSWAGAQDEEFAVFPEHYRGGTETRTTLELNFATIPAEGMIFCRIVADFYINEARYCRCALTCRFKVADESWSERFDEEQQAIIFEKATLTHFGAFTTGMLRGYLFARQQNSPISAFLPPVNVVAMVEDFGDFKIELPSSLTEAEEDPTQPIT